MNAVNGHSRKWILAACLKRTGFTLNKLGRTSIFYIEVEMLFGEKTKIL